MFVIDSRSIRSAMYAGSVWPPGSARTMVAPTISGQRNSQTDTSKLNGVFCISRSDDVRPKSSCFQSRRLVRPAWSTITPLGCPVEPEV